MLSFIVPAHNEEALIGASLRRLRESAQALGEPFEVIVVDDASTDRTTEIAQSEGASVVSVNRRQIAAVRNEGARVAKGDLFFFVDADTHVFEGTLREALAAIRDGAVGGGAAIRVESNTPMWAKGAYKLTSFLMRALDWAAGCFVFVRRADFEAVGGFDERYFATEEIVLSRALKARGRMVIVNEPVLTSARKAHLYPASEMPRMVWNLARHGSGFLRRRENLDIWYDGRR